MIYYSGADVIIRDMETPDAEKLFEAELAQGWHPELEGYLKRLEDRRAGRAVALIAECGGEVAGKAFLYPDSPWGAFGGKDLPELVDLCVFERFQRRGIGGKLMDVAAGLAKRQGSVRIEYAQRSVNGDLAWRPLSVSANADPALPLTGESQGCRK